VIIKESRESNCKSLRVNLIKDEKNAIEQNIVLTKCLIYFKSKKNKQ